MSWNVLVGGNEIVFHFPQFLWWNHAKKGRPTDPFFVSVKWYGGKSRYTGRPLCIGPRASDRAFNLCQDILYCFLTIWRGKKGGGKKNYTRLKHIRAYIGLKTRMDRELNHKINFLKIPIFQLSKNILRKRWKRHGPENMITHETPSTYAHAWIIQWSAFTNLESVPLFPPSHAKENRITIPSLKFNGAQGETSSWARNGNKCSTHLNIKWVET